MGRTANVSFAYSSKIFFNHKSLNDRMDIRFDLHNVKLVIHRLTLIFLHWCGIVILSP